MEGCGICLSAQLWWSFPSVYIYQNIKCTPSTRNCLSIKTHYNCKQKALSCQLGLPSEGQAYLGRSLSAWLVGVKLWSMPYGGKARTVCSQNGMKNSHLTCNPLKAMTWKYKPTGIKIENKIKHQYEKHVKDFPENGKADSLEKTF